MFGNSSNFFAGGTGSGIGTEQLAEQSRLYPPIEIVAVTDWPAAPVVSTVIPSPSMRPALVDQRYRTGWPPGEFALAFSCTLEAEILSGQPETTADAAVRLRVRGANTTFFRMDF